MSRSRLHAYIQSPVSTEGLVDTLKKLFTTESKTKKADTPFSPEVNKFKWLKEAQAQANSTYANLNWVTDNLNPRELKAPKLAQSLSYKGRVPKKPAETLKHITDILSTIQAKVPAIERYTQSLKQLEKEADGWSGDADAISSRLMAEARKIKLVYSPGDKTPELFNGTMYVVSRHYSVDKKENDHYKADSDTLPALTAEEIVSAAKGVFALAEAILHLEGDRGLYPGSDCDRGVWNKLDYQDYYGPDLWDLMHFQCIPSVAKDMVMFPIYDLYVGPLFSIMKWIYSQVSEDVVSMESIDGDDVWVSYL